MNKPITHSFLGVLLLFFATLSLKAQVPTFTLSPTSITKAVNESFTVDVKVSNFHSIISMQYGIRYRSNVLQLLSIDYPTPIAGLGAASVSTTVSGTTGIITNLWNDDAGNAHDLPDNTTLFTLHFKGVSDCNDTLRFGKTNTNLAIEIGQTQANGTDINVGMNPVNSTLKIGTGCTYTPPPPAGWAILTDPVSGKQGDTVLMNVKVQKFTAITGMQYFMFWDKTKLQYLGPQNFNLPDFSANSFLSAVPATAQAAGKVFLSWYDASQTLPLTGVTKPDNTIIYKVKFKILGTAGETTQVTFGGGSPPDQPAEYYDINSTSGMTFQSVPSTFTVTSAPPPQPTNEPLFIADKDSVQQNGITCIDIKVKNFTKVVGVQFQVKYNPAELQFDHFTVPTPPPMPAVNPYPTLGNLANNSTAGTISFAAWSAPDVLNGLTLADGTVFFTACFKALGAVGSTSVVSFGGNPPTFPVEGYQGDGTQNSTAFTPQFTNGSVYVTNVAPPCSLTITKDSTHNIKCKNGSDGEIFTTLGGTTNSNPVYTWSGPTTNIPSMGDIGGLKAGTYNLTVTAGTNNTCSATLLNIVLTEPTAALSLPTPTYTNLKCFGAADGTITLAPTGGTAPYKYTWSGPPPAPGNVANPTGLKGGSYKATITDANGCSLVSDLITIAQPADFKLDLSKVTSVGVKCFGDLTGAISLNNAITGGTQPYTYTWTGPNGFPTTMTKDLTGLKAGIYTLTAMDNNGCGPISFSKTIDQPLADLAVSTLSKKDVKCFGGNEGEICIQVSGGTAPYTYAWLGQSTTTACLTGKVAGSYTVNVTDANGCSKAYTDLIGGPTTALNTTNTTVNQVSCFGGNDGSACITAIGGTAPYGYVWSNGSTINCATNLSQGPAGVTVSDAKGCVYVQNVTVPGPSAALNTFIATNPGQAALTVTGGTPSYTYFWSGPNGFTSQSKDLNGVAGGQYFVTVTDSKGCTKTDVTNIPSTISTTSAPGATPCAGEINGTVLVNINGGTAPFSVSWAYTGPGITGQGGPISATSSPYVIGGLPGNINIAVTVTDASGSTSVSSTALFGNAPINLSLNSSNPVFPSFDNGSVKVTVTTGTPPYQFAWSKNGTPVGPTFILSGQDTSKVIGQDEGMYCVTITDANGCTAKSCNQLIRQYPPIDLVWVPTNSKCGPTDPTGSILLTVSGGDGIYDITWNGPNVSNVKTKDLTGLVAGTYTVVVKDGHGQIHSPQSVVIVAQSNLTSTLSVLSSCGQYNICNRQECNGTAVVNTLNGVSPINYAWGNGEANQTATELCFGTGCVTVSDAVGCRDTLCYNITAPESIIPSVEIKSTPKCFGECNGVAQATPAGGVPPYTFHWSSDEGGQVATKLCKGWNYVTITDQFNAVVDSFLMTGADSLYVELAEITKPSDFETCDGVVVATMVNGSLPIQFYAWNKAGVFGNKVETACPGEKLIVTIKDHNGCTASAMITVSYPDGQCLTARKAITPENPDNKNDNFFIACVETLTQNNLEVYNRWGQLVYEKKNYDNSWDGTYNGQPGKYLPEGVYFWVLTYKGSNGETIQRKDYLNILRGN